MTAKDKRRQIKQEARSAKTEKRRGGKEGVPSASSPENGRGKSPVERGIYGPETLFNRELSWVAFNGRVLEEAFRETHPLLERLKFLAIFTSNLDEFFLIRFAGLLRQVAQGVEIPSPDGMTPLRQITALREAILPQLEEQRRCWKERLLPLLAREGIRVEEYPRVRPGARRKLDAYFEREVLPILTPQAVDGGRPFPHVSSGSLNLLVLLQDEQERHRFARLKIPRTFPRFVPVAEEEQEALSGTARRLAERNPSTFVWIEDVVTENLDALFPGFLVKGAWPFRVLRDADLEIQEDEAPDLLSTVEEGVEQRFFGVPAALVVGGEMPSEARSFLVEHLEVAPYQVFEVEGRLDFSSLMELYRLDRSDLKDAPFLSAAPKLDGGAEAFPELLRKRDLLLFHPYDAFSPVVDFLRWASRDSQVLAIKMTLYRVGQNSPVVESLMEARQNGKQVAALVELKARFDEENNIVWARALERAGVHVVYGLSGLKTHAKMCLVVRRENKGIRRYVHLGTGNYNPSTAGIYTDLGYFTADPDMGEDVADLFNVITGYARREAYRRLLVAPTTMRDGLVSRIDREIRKHREEGGGRIIFKMNALVDEACIAALYRAAAAGVRVDLQVRGICCLCPGLPGTEKTLTVTSIVGRFLEHSRLYYFRNGGAEELFLGSADLMPRNLDRRVEVLFPVLDRELLRTLVDQVLEVHLRDTVHARLLGPDGIYRARIPAEGEVPVNAQATMLAGRGILYGELTSPAVSARLASPPPEAGPGTTRVVPAGGDGA